MRLCVLIGRPFLKGVLFMVLFLAVCAFSFMGCRHVRQEETAQNVANEDSLEQERAVLESILEKLKPLDEETRFRRMLQSGEEKAGYEAAFRCISGLSPDDRLEPSSLRFSTWYILFVKKTSHSNIHVTDESASERVYLVDLAQCALKNGDYDTAMPFFDRLFKLAKRLDDEDERNDLALKVANAVIAIKDHRSNLVEESENVEDGGSPQFDFENGDPTLVFYRKTGDGMSVSFESVEFQCVQGKYVESSQ